MISFFMLEIIHGMKFHLRIFALWFLLIELYKTFSTPLVLLSTVHFSPSPRCHSPRHSWIPAYASEGPSSFTLSLLAKTAVTHSLRGERCLGREMGERCLGGGVHARDVWVERWVRDVWVGKRCLGGEAGERRLGGEVGERPLGCLEEMFQVCSSFQSLSII